MVAENSEYLTIGKVVKKLKKDFPDISISKIRFLEEENLLSLSRTKGGYRKFDQDDINKLELILKMQKDLFLPLDVIKEKLQISPEPILRKEIEKGSKKIPDQKILTSDLYNTMSLKEFRSSTGLSIEEVKKLENYGILRKPAQKSDKPYSRIDVEIVKTAKELSSYGIEPRHLRMYINSVEREVDLFKQIILPTLHAKNKNRRKKAEKILTSLWKNTLQIKNLLFKKNIGLLIKEEFVDNE